MAPSRAPLTSGPPEDSTLGSPVGGASGQGVRIPWGPAQHSGPQGWCPLDGFALHLPLTSGSLPMCLGSGLFILGPQFPQRQGALPHESAGGPRSPPGVPSTASHCSCTQSFFRHLVSRSPRGCHAAPLCQGPRRADSLVGRDRPRVVLESELWR